MIPQWLEVFQQSESYHSSKSEKIIKMFAGGIGLMTFLVTYLSLVSGATLTNSDKLCQAGLWWFYV